MVLAMASTAHAVAPASCATRAATSLGRTPRPASARRSMRRGTAILTLFLGATCLASMGRSAAVPAPRRPTNRALAYTPHARRRPVRHTVAMPRPIPGLASTWFPSHRFNCLELSYKAGRSSPRASTEPPLSAIGALTVNSTPACFSSQTRAAPHSTRTPSSSCARLLACPCRRLTGASVHASAAGQPSMSSAPCAIPEPTNRLSTSPRSQ
jgi:hypothetical protein